MITPRLALAYRRTLFEACGARSRVGQSSPALGSIIGRQSGVFITAWNPMSHRHPHGWNKRANRRLDEWLRRHPAWPARGSYRGWHEAHVLVVADPRRMVPIARRFRQAAIVVVKSGQALRLVLIA